MKKLLLVYLMFVFALVQANAVAPQQQSSPQHSDSSSNQAVQTKPPKYGIVRCRLYDKNCKLVVDISERANFQEDRLNSSNFKIFRYDRPHLEAIKEQNGTAKSEEIYEIPLVTVQVGKANLIMTTPDGETTVIAQVIITRPYRGIDVAFDVFLWVYCGLVSLIMGILVDRDLIKSVLTGNRQKEVGLTFGCQYFLMPLLAFGITKVFAIKPFECLTLFIYGCCPSSFESTKWSEIFNGDVELNKFSSFVSTLFAIIMMPAWLYSLGSVLMENAGFRLPIAGLALNMTILIAPAFIGYILGSFMPGIKLFANIANKLIHSIIFIALFLTLILTSRLYAFRLGNPLFILIGPMIAFLGYIIGASLAWLFGLPCNKIKSVSLHTGFQNIVFAFLVVNWNFPSPEVDYILVCLVPVFLQTSLPIKIIFLVKKIRGCIRRRRGDASSSGAASRPTKIEVDAEKLPEQEPIYENRQ